MQRGVRNPFRYGALALDKSFADRSRELDALVRDARNGQDVVVFAPRRYGKSSLVWRAAQRLTAQRALVAEVDLMTTPTKERLAGKLAETIFENIASVLERTRERALAPLRGLRIQPVVSVDPESGAFRFRFSLAHAPEDVDATLERLLELPGELGAARRRPVVLVLDEFQQIVELDPHLPRLMRSVFQRQPEVAHVYLGSRRHVMERIFSDENEPFWRSARPLELGRIPAEEFVPFVEERFAATGKRIQPEAAARLVAVTEGHPHATQELAYFLWEITAPGRAASAGDLAAALEEVLRAEDARFTLLWEGLAAGQRLVLEALAAEQPSRPLAAEYRRRHDLPPPSAVQRALQALAQRELVERDGREWRIAEPFLAEWIARRS